MGSDSISKTVFSNSSKEAFDSQYLEQTRPLYEMTLRLLYSDFDNYMTREPWVVLNPQNGQLLLTESGFTHIMAKKEGKKERKIYCKIEHMHRRRPRPLVAFIKDKDYTMS
jgi:hypothetical protein